MGDTLWPREFPGAHWLDGEEDRAVLDVLHGGTLFRHYGLTQPKYVTAFEDAARSFYGVRHALAVNSGTGALITAVTALGVGPGCEVILPSFLWVATVAAVVNANAIPVLCEVDDSFTMDPEDLERRITPRTKLILPVHMAGAPADMDAIMDIARRHGIPVLEDTAQCNGGSFRGDRLGSIGDIGMFSLQINKNITAGEGGLVITDDDGLHDRLQAAHDTGFIWKDGAPAEPPDDVLMWGSGRRMSELIGAVASVQMRKLPEVTARMRASHDRIASMLDGTPGLGFRRFNDPDGHTGPFLVIMLDSGEKAVDAVRRMAARGLDSVARLADYGLHIYSNIPQLVLKRPLSPSGNPWNLVENRECVYDYGRGACPRSDELFARSILIPIPSRLTAEQEEWAAGVIRDAVTGKG